MFWVSIVYAEVNLEKKFQSYYIDRQLEIIYQSNCQSVGVYFELQRFTFISSLISKLSLQPPLEN